MAERLPGELGRQRRRRRADGDRAPDRGPGGPARAARSRPSPRAGPGRAGRPGRPASPAPRARGRGDRRARVDADRGRRRPAIRTLDPDQSGWTRRRRPGRTPAGRPLGPRQLAALRELAASPPGEVLAAELAGRHGQAAVAGLVRRGLAAAEVRERPRRPLGDPSGRAAWRPAGVERPAAGAGGRRRADPWRHRRRRPPAAPARWRDRCRQDGDLRRGDRGLARGRPAGPRAGSRDRAGAPAGRSPAGRPGRPDRAAPFGAGRRGAGRRVAPDPGRRRGHRGRHATGGHRAAR